MWFLFVSEMNGAYDKIDAIGDYIVLNKPVRFTTLI